MNTIGGQELMLPALHAGEDAGEVGRHDLMGDNLFKLRDRRDATGLRPL